MGKTLSAYLRSLLTPFNAVAALIILVALPLAFLRFAHGLGAATNLSDTNPWGLWIGFDVMSGVALAAGGFVTAGLLAFRWIANRMPVFNERPDYRDDHALAGKEAR